MINLQYSTIPYPVPSFIYQGIEPYIRNSNVYHPQDPTLIKKLAKKHNISESMIYLTAGAEDAIFLLSHTFGNNTYVFTPTFISYDDSKVFGKHILHVPSLLGDKYQINTEKKNDATLIFLANPNNPCGITSREAIIELIQNNTHAIVAIDEPYAELTGISVLDLVSQFENVAVIRSFSKGYCLAGMRIGYIVAKPEVREKLKIHSTWANVSYPAIGAAIIALDHEDYFENIRKEVINTREEFVSFLESQNLHIVPSYINVVLLKFNTENRGKEFVQFLKEHNVLVNYGNADNNVGLDNSFVRIAIGTPSEMKTVQEIISNYSL